MNLLTPDPIVEYDEFLSLQMPEANLELDQETFAVETKSLGESVRSFMGALFTEVAADLVVKAITGCDPTIGTIALLSTAIPDILEQATSFFSGVEIEHAVAA
ncbi:MAG: hypothetical protein H6619_03545 [Deltaproteobacteria bacterium]|nr:hypothetical protein [Deltaproteobacteria bacterium]